MAGSPSAPIPCPPTTGLASLGGPEAGPLTCTPSGGFNGATPLTYTYEWLRESTVIAGATASTYALTADDAGHLLACRVRGANAYGSYRAISNARRAPGTIFVEPEPTATPVADTACATADPDPDRDPGAHGHAEARARSRCRRSSPRRCSRCRRTRSASRGASSGSA